MVAEVLHSVPCMTDWMVVRVKKKRTSSLPCVGVVVVGELLCRVLFLLLTDGRTRSRSISPHNGQSATANPWLTNETTDFQQHQQQQRSSRSSNHEWEKCWLFLLGTYSQWSPILTTAHRCVVIAEEGDQSLSHNHRVARFVGMFLVPSYDYITCHTVAAVILF